MILRLRCTSAVWCALAILLAPAIGLSQTPEPVVSITAEPDHKIRFDNGKVRMYEVRLAKGQATLMHEHLADSFSVMFRDTEISIEQLDGATTNSSFSAGRVGFASTEQGPYAHRVVASKDTDFHVIAMELMRPALDPLVGREQRADPRIQLVLENPRGRAYRIRLAPGESTGPFVRPGATAVFAISAGRVAEKSSGERDRLWDFETGHFRWMDDAQALTLKNEGSTPVDLVEIEVY